MEKDKFFEIMGFAGETQLTEYICDQCGIDSFDELDSNLETKHDMVEFIYESNFSDDPSGHVRRIMQNYTV
jgi:hypothetical protein